MSLAVTGANPIVLQTSWWTRHMGVQGLYGSEKDVHTGQGDRKLAAFGFLPSKTVREYHRRGLSSESIEVTRTAWLVWAYRSMSEAC